MSPAQQNSASSPSAAQLCEAFAEFEDAAHTLSTFYHTLEHQVGQLTAELAASRAEQARELAEKERLAARLASLLQALPGGVVVLDQHGSVQEFNPAATDLLGAISNGDKWAAIVARAFAPRWDDGHDVSLADGRRVNIATQALSGEPGQILLLKDVSETRRLQDQLAHHKRLSAKTEMAAAMAHQIRTPLAVALLNTSNVRRGRDAAERDRAIERALKSLRKLERLVDEMLLFARGGRLAVDEVSAAEVLATLEAAVIDAFTFKEFQLVFAPAPRDLTIHANVAALTSISLNLIENACHACRGKGQLHISAAAHGDQLEIVFQDDGPGVPATAAAAIFEPFFSTRANGTGLGLSVARAIARAHGGELGLDVDRAAGARFELRLPLATVSHTNPAATLQLPGADAGGPPALRHAG